MEGAVETARVWRYRSTEEKRRIVEAALASDKSGSVKCRDRSVWN